MKRYYDIFLNFAIVTECETYEEYFTSDWKFTDMLDFMCDRFAINKDSIVEIRQTYIKRYKVSKDD